MNLRPTLFDLTLFTIFANQQSHCAVQFSGVLSLTSSFLQMLSTSRHAVLKHVSVSATEGTRIDAHLVTLIIHVYSASRLLGCDTLSLGVYFWTFRRSHCLHLQSLSASEISDPEEKTLKSFQTSLSIHPTAPHPFKPWTLCKTAVITPNVDWDTITVILQHNVLHLLCYCYY
jgi:hypothetical protein